MNIQKILTILALLAAIVSCAHKNENPQKLKDLLQTFWEERAPYYPLEATQQGDNRFNDLLPNDQSEKFREEMKFFFTTYLKKAEAIDRAGLDDSDKISLDLFIFERKMNLEDFQHPFWMMPFQQFWGLPLTMGQLGSGEQFQPFKTEKDFRNWMKRLKGFKIWSESAIDNFRIGMKKGVILPKILVNKMIPQMRDLANNDVAKNVFFGPLKKLPADLTAAKRQKLQQDFTAEIMNTVIPTYAKMAEFLEKEYLPHARNSHGIDGVNGGKEMYRYLVRVYTTTNKTPDEIHALGLTEVARIRGEMERIKSEVSFKGDLKSFFKHLNTDKKFTPYKTPEDVLNAFRKIHQTIEPKLSTLFGTFPKSQFEIRQTEEFRAATASAEYSVGSPDGKRPGIFYVPIINAAQFNITSGMESLFLHEAIPGHHFQISLQQENMKLPEFRKFGWYGAYGEGWALYTESLGKELGLYTNPYQYMGALGDEMHRALRLVVDVAIHTKGMTRDQAVAYMMDNEQIPYDAAVAEIERYMAIPGQALGYKVGSLKIRELREKYQKKQGTKFSISRFHDEVLKEGCLPLSVLESHMDEVMK